jgi:uncharacterized repeat protein (TIGR01451 family)
MPLSGLAITKTRTSGSPVAVGQVVTFEIVIENSGGITLTNISLTDTYDTTVLDYASASLAPDGTVDDGELHWSDVTGVGVLGIGEKLTVTVRFTATAAAQNTVNMAVASATDNQGDPVPEVSDSDTVTITAPGLEIVKRLAPGVAVRNMPFTYTVWMTNTGDVLLDPVLLTDTLPAGFHFVAGSGAPFAPTVVGGVQETLIWSGLGPLAPSEGISVSFVVTGAPDALGIYQNIVVGEGVHPSGSITDTDDVPISIVDPSVDVSKDVQAPGTVDGVITFTIRITNTGPSTIDVLPLYDYFSGDITYIGGDPLADPIDNANGVLTWLDLTDHFGDMAPGEVYTLSTVFSITANTETFTATNRAVVTDTIDVYDNPANDDDDTEVIIDGPTPIELLYLRATPGPEMVVVEWATEVEVDTYGFYLLRSESGSLADAQQIAFIDAQGHGWGEGATYRFEDRAVRAEADYTYWLVDVDTAGQRTVHGPTMAVAPMTVRARIYLPIVARRGTE